MLGSAAVAARRLRGGGQPGSAVSSTHCNVSGKSGDGDDGEDGGDDGDDGEQQKDEPDRRAPPAMQSVRPRLGLPLG